MKRTIITIFVVFILIVVGIWGGIAFEKQHLKNQVEDYLLNKGYKSDEIQYIKPFFGKAPLSSVRVIFNDEPNVIYYYRNDKGIRQFGTPTEVTNTHTNIDFKHQEK